VTNIFSHAFPPHHHFEISVTGTGRGRVLVSQQPVEQLRMHKVE